MRFTQTVLITIAALTAFAFLIFSPGRETPDLLSAAVPANDALPAPPAKTPADVVTKGLVLKDGMLYHGVYPGHCKELNKGRRTEDCSIPRNLNPRACNNPDDESGEEDNVTCADVLSYEDAAGGLAAWVYFSNNWDTEAHAKFPVETAKWIRARGSVPFIRLMLRKSTNEIKEANHVEEVDNYRYNLDHVLSTDRAVNADDKLYAWGIDAKRFATPLIVEFGTEVNNSSHAWNGMWNGREAGADKFKRAYQHIVNVIRDRAGATNVIWVFHADASPSPDPAAGGATWNTVASYYPGKDYVDWLGLSAYGPQMSDEDCESFHDVMDRGYKELEAATADDPTKPVFVLEFGITGDHGKCNPGTWVNEALTELLAGRTWPRVRGFSWWNEVFKNGPGKKKTNTRLQSHSRIRNAFRAHLLESDRGKVIYRPIFAPGSTP
jgi:hypothetical protein